MEVELMGKDKTGKLDVLFDVNDKDLKTPKHDELCIWVDTNIKRILYRILDKKYGDIISHFLGTNDGTNVNDSTTHTTFQLDWEEPIKGHNGFVIGIPDFRYSIYHWEKFRRVGEIWKESFLFGGYIEVKPIIKSIGETMRQIKLYRSCFIGSDGAPFHNGQYSFKWHEAKENHYDFFIVTNSTEYKPLFEKQGIFYITPQTETEKPKVRGQKEKMI